MPIREQAGAVLAVRVRFHLVHFDFDHPSFMHEQLLQENLRLSRPAALAPLVMIVEPFKA